MKTLYLIDGYAQFFRAYHAIRTPMTSPVTGEPTNMTFGFAGMLLKLLRGEGRQMGGLPDYVAVVLDVSGDRGTVRSEIYPAYKATRPPPPEDLRPQVDRCLGMLEILGVPVLGMERYEADDVIASLVCRLREEQPGLRIRIISKDKDLKQLLEEGAVELFDIHTDEIIDVGHLKEQTGLDPGHVVDMLTLMGDTVDNVPGVEGIGPKTAAQLIVQYGSLENLLARADEIKGKRGERLREAAPRLDISKRLVTLHRDLEIDFDLEKAAASGLKVASLVPVFKELGFNRYQDEAGALAAGEARPTAAGSGGRSAWAPPLSGGLAGGGLFDHLVPQSEKKVEGAYVCVRTLDELAGLARSLEEASAVSVDTETTDLSPMRCRLCGLSFSVEPGKGWYVPVRSPEAGAHLDEETVLGALRPILEDATKPKIGHNIKYDLLVLRKHGVSLRGVAVEGACDTMVAAWLVDASRSAFTLDALSLALLGRTNISIKELIGSGKSQKSFDQVPLEQATVYAAEDADATLQLCGKLGPELKAMGLDRLAHDVELPLIEVLAELEWNGVLVDSGVLDQQRGALAGRITELNEKIQDEAMATCGRTFDTDSPRQLAGILFNKPDAAEPGLGIRPGRKTKTGYSTDAEVLEKLASDAGIESPIPGLVLEYRQLTKLVNTYLVSLKEEINPRTGRVHSSFNQTGAATGRLSSSDPNLQNIPIRTDVGREIRKAFIAPRGRLLITADYSQIELRLLAHLSRDPGLIEAFERGEDIHTAVAAQIHGVRPEDVTREQRGGAKMVNFGIVYGITAFGLARRLGVSNTAADEIITGYKKRFAGITTFLQECVEHARRHGYVETMLGRRRPIRDIDAREPQRRAFAERIAINSVVQGSAADLIKLAMIDLHGRLSPSAPHWREGRLPEFEGVLMLLQIHDELVFEAPEATAEGVRDLIVERMEKAMELSVPIKAEAHISTNWYEGK